MSQRNWGNLGYNKDSEGQREIEITCRPEKDRHERMNQLGKGKGWLACFLGFHFTNQDISLYSPGLP